VKDKAKDWDDRGRHIPASIEEYNAELNQHIKLNSIGRG